MFLYQILSLAVYVLVTQACYILGLQIGDNSTRKTAQFTPRSSNGF